MKRKKKAETKAELFFKNLLQSEKECDIISRTRRESRAQGYSSAGRVPVSKTVGRGFESSCPCQKIQVARLGFFHLCRKAQHRLRACTQHHLSVSSTSLPPRAAQMNEVALLANDVLRNDVLFCLRQNAMMLRFAQTNTPPP